jgi:hypothetical protein
MVFMFEAGATPLSGTLVKYAPGFNLLTHSVLHF